MSFIPNYIERNIILNYDSKKTKLNQNSYSKKLALACSSVSLSLENDALSLFELREIFWLLMFKDKLIQSDYSKDYNNPIRTISNYPYVRLIVT